MFSWVGGTIVFVWSQYDGGNIDKEQCLRFLPKPNEAKLNIIGGDLAIQLPSISMCCATHSIYRQSPIFLSLTKGFL